MPVTESAREIALAFGVPPMLLAIPGDNTYANYQEANRAFWRQSVLPLAARIACALTNWLAPAFGDGLVLAADTDRVEALASDRAALWERVSNATFLTVNEKRLATGYGGRPFSPIRVRYVSRAWGAPIHDRFCGNFHRARRSRAPRLAAMGGVGERSAWFALRELTAASRRFDDFVR